MEKIILNVVRQMDVEKGERANGSDIPMEISDELANSTLSQFQVNFRKLKRDAHKYNLDEFNTICKFTENTRFLACVTMEMFEQLQYDLADTPSPAEASSIIANVLNKAKELPSLISQPQNLRKGKPDNSQTNCCCRGLHLYDQTKSSRGAS
ncbi:MAG: hypothetical protein EXX96DRAFT_623211 [Benjaminiella poitrasii]|nr:MAG: hypothetical protein EXX96DRAFT_623211 [Benjaminiella poitrasii]